LTKSYLFDFKIYEQWLSSGSQHKYGWRFVLLVYNERLVSIHSNFFLENLNTIILIFNIVVHIYIKEWIGHDYNNNKEGIVPKCGRKKDNFYHCYNMSYQYSIGYGSMVYGCPCHGPHIIFATFHFLIWR